MVIKKFLRISAAVRWPEGIDKVNVRLPRFFAGRLVATAVSQLLLELLQLDAELFPVVNSPLLWTTSCESNGAAPESAFGGLLFEPTRRWTVWLSLILSSRFWRDGLNVKPTMPCSSARGMTDLELFQYCSWIV